MDESKVRETDVKTRCVHQLRVDTEGYMNYRSI